MYVALPTFFYSFVVVFPLFFTFYLSLHEWSGLGQPTFIGIKNFVQLFTNDSMFLISLLNNLIIFVAMIVVRLTIPFFLAVLIHERIKGWRLFRNVFFIPTTMAVAITGILWRRIFDPINGPLNELGRNMEWQALARAEWLYDPSLALPSVLLAGFWRWIGFTMVIFLAGLQSINPDYYDAATVDGASWWRRLWHITIPLLKPTFALNFIWIWSHAMRIFDIIWVMTAAEFGPRETTSVLTTWLFVQGFRFNNFGYGSAVAMVLLLITFIVAVIQLRMFKLKEARL